MKLKDKIQIFKESNPNRLEHTFKNGMKFKGSGEYKLHYWLDSIYKDVVNEWHSFKTEKNKSFLEEIIK